ncbi:MAG TPA: aminotransferase class I/II-fold pyridoxal phosphate-dependent enzyme, partial [Thermomicrobiales bacterium]|nr:aminotransferase class I/II-fold pyridoxal phosphate-dependent enzyme [Thermomicrobiales bacterium]
MIVRTPARRITSFRETVFAEMSALSVVHRAVNLGQGFPDFAAPGFVKEAARAAIAADANQYAHPSGVPALRAAIAAEWGARFGPDIDPDHEVTVTSGATEAIFDAIMALVDPGQA